MGRFAKETGLNAIFAIALTVPYYGCGNPPALPGPEVSDASADTVGVGNSEGNAGFNGTKGAASATGAKGVAGSTQTAGTAGRSGVAGAQCDPNDSSTLSNCRTGTVGTASPCCTTNGRCGISFGGNCRTFAMPDGGIVINRDAGTSPGRDASTRPVRDSGPRPERDSGASPQSDSGM